jgi:hypothetical protein
MGARLPSSFSNTVASTIPGAGEIVVCVVPPLSPVFDSTAVLLCCWANVVAGATVVSVQLRIYRGTTVGGVRLNTNAAGATTVAGNTFYVSACYFDVPGNVAGQQYCFSLTCGGATGATIVNDVAMLAFVL